MRRQTVFEGLKLFPEALLELFLVVARLGVGVCSIALLIMNRDTLKRACVLMNN